MKVGIMQFGLVKNKEKFGLLLSAKLSADKTYGTLIGTWTGKGTREEKQENNFIIFSDNFAA